MPNLSSKLYEDYPIDDETLTSDVKLASVISLVFLSIIGMSGSVVIFYFYTDTLDFTLTTINRLTIAIIISLTIYFLGALGGLFWQRFGLWVASNTYQVYLDQFRPKIFAIFGRLYMKFVGENKIEDFSI